MVCGTRILFLELVGNARKAMPSGVKHKVLLAASEAVGFAKTGGLADVAGSLPQALSHRGYECAVILPLYRSARLGKIPLTRTDHVIEVPVGSQVVTGRLWQAKLPDADVPVFLVEQPDYFERDDHSQGRSLYQFTLPTGQKRDFPDNCERFVFFTRFVLELLPRINFWPDILHVNDWQTGLAPVYLNEVYRKCSSAELRRRYENIRTVFTIHNIAYQGLFWHWDMPLTGLDWQLFNYRQLEFFGHLSFLKAGIVFADFVTTVSPTYAKEIQTPYFGCGLEGVLTERRERLFGIVNGVDYRIWNPATDPHLEARYDIETMGERKPLCKAALQRRCGLPQRASTPLLGMVARLVEQKGPDLVAKAADSFLRDDVQLVLLGEGDAVYHRLFRALRDRFPDRFGLTLGFDEALAHQIEGGADIFLMPSLFEPSGLNQLYSLKYGTVPIVRATGGLADTITDWTPRTLAAGTATGFTFQAHTGTTLKETVGRAVELYRNHPEQWLQLIQTGMRQDWSWERSAGEYERVYSMVRELTIPPS